MAGTSDNVDVMLAMPTRQTPTQAAFAAAAAESTRSGAMFAWFAGEPIAFNRNQIVSQFLKHPRKLDAILFVDDDVIIPEGVIRACAVIDKPVVNVPTPFFLKGRTLANCGYREFPGGTIINPESDGDYLWPEWWQWSDDRPPHRIDACGFGCVYIQRWVLEKLEWPWFHFDYGDANGKGSRGEDVYFCKRCEESGIEIWCLPQLECGHLKQVDLRSFVPMEAVGRAKSSAAGENMETRAG